MRIDYVFLDDGDVMNDNALRAPQWQRLVGEFFAPRLGGSEAAWAAANRDTIDGVNMRFELKMTTDRTPGWSYNRAVFEYAVDWLRSMCELVRVTAPGNDVDCALMARVAADYITPRVDAAYPGVIGAIRVLGAERGLYTASNEWSHEVRGYLTGMGVDALFRGFYGTDLVGLSKRSGVIYYEGVFRHAGVDPARCLVVDDKPAFLAAAREVGARTVRVGAGQALSADEPVIGALADLPALIDSL